MSIVLTNHDDMIFTRVYGDKTNEQFKAINSVIFNEVVETVQLKALEKLKASEISFRVYIISEENTEPYLEIDKEKGLLYVTVLNKKYFINF